MNTNKNATYSMLIKHLLWNKDELKHIVEKYVPKCNDDIASYIKMNMLEVDNNLKKLSLLQRPTRNRIIFVYIIVVIKF